MLLAILSIVQSLVGAILLGLDIGSLVAGLLVLFVFEAAPIAVAALAGSPGGSSQLAVRLLAAADLLLAVIVAPGVGVYLLPSALILVLAAAVLPVVPSRAGSQSNPQ